MKGDDMNKPIAALALTLLAAGAASAQTPPRRVQAPQSRFSIDTPIRDLIANPAAKAALDKEMPGISTHAMLPHFQHLSMRTLAASPHASIPASRVQALQAALAKIR
jgi:hypothetical protein